MRRAAKTDGNQAEIVHALRGIGATVLLLHQVGGGCPDILVGRLGQNWLFEIKDRRGKLTPEEKTFFNFWKGQASVIYSAQEAIDILNGFSSPADVPPF